MDNTPMDNTPMDNKLRTRGDPSQKSKQARFGASRFTSYGTSTVQSSRASSPSSATTTSTAPSVPVTDQMIQEPLPATATSPHPNAVHTTNTSIMNLRYASSMPASFATSFLPFSDPFSQDSDVPRLSPQDVQTPLYPRAPHNPTSVPISNRGPSYYYSLGTRTDTTIENMQCQQQEDNQKKRKHVSSDEEDSGSSSDEEDNDGGTRSHFSNNDTFHDDAQIDNNTSDVSTATMRKTVRTEDDAIQSESKSHQKTSFDERCNQLLRFKEEFGHCSVPCKYRGNQSLWNWCSHMRNSYQEMQKGTKPQYSLSQDMIGRLEEIGFQWRCDRDLITFKEETQSESKSSSKEDDSHIEEADDESSTNASNECDSFKSKPKRKSHSFDERCIQFLQFKEEFGHRNAPVLNAVNPSLGKWCYAMRGAYKSIQKGEKTSYNLSLKRIERLEEIGFQWQSVVHDEVFEKRCFELESFKEEFGHCNIPGNYTGNLSLGRWCKHIRHAYKCILKGMKSKYKLSKERIEKLEEIGFQFGKTDKTHNSLPTTETDYDNTAKSASKMKNLSKDWIDLPEDLGFQRPAAVVPESPQCNVGGKISDHLNESSSNLRGVDIALVPDPVNPSNTFGKLAYKSTRRDGVFEKHCDDLAEFKEEFGHCSVPQMYPGNPALGRWCKNLRTAYRNLQKGINSSIRLSDDRVKLLEDLGFQWTAGDKKNIKMN